MTSEFWGMTAFFATTLVFMGATLYFALKANRLQRQLSQLQEKANQSQSPRCERQYKK